ncbi:MAG: cadherin-like domain-containing protein, partial [Caldilineaceae bacterium]|nr:cadherin-like domain-containing protein [Caldilineaceae bacterium]
GVLFEDSDNNTIGGTGNGEGNRIAFNSEDGIAVDSASRNNRFLANEIFSNNQLGIDLGNDGVTPNDNGDGDSGANDKQNTPILAGALIDNNRLETQAVLSSTPNTTFRIDFFAGDSCDSSGFGEGATFLGSGSMTTNSGGNGQLDINFPPIPDGQQVTATATSNNGNGNTSEFSECVSVFTLSPPAAPQLTPDTATTNEDTPVTIDVLQNDFRGSGSALTIVAVGDPQSGTAQIVDNQIVYTPDANFSGGDSFFYSAHNGNTANTRQTTVRVQVTEIVDGPSDILLTSDTVVEGSPSGTRVGRFTAVTDGSTRFLSFSLVGSDNDNSNFSVFLGTLRLATVPDFETKSSYVLDVQVRDIVTNQRFSKRLTVNVTDANDAPTAINLSNNRIDENQSAGVTVGTLSSQDVDAGDSHSYALVDGSGSDDNAKFRINGSTLQTNALLDFEE